MTAPCSSPLQTEFPFTLPRGYLDSQGELHREGTMRLATALDEIAPLRDPRVKDNPAYVTVVILSRVITRLGTLAEVNTTTVEKLFASDLAYLQTLYRRLNGDGEAGRTLTCPKCQHNFPAEDRAPGVVSYPLDALFEEVAFIAYHFHWSLSEILNLEHHDRRRFIEEISAINRRINEPEGPTAGSGTPLQFWEPGERRERPW